jgi:carbamoyltransferase
MIILGINSVYHESSVCLIVNGKLIAAIEEERLIRVKHAKEAKIDNPDELPLLTINKCLEMGKVKLEEVDKIGFSFDPEKRLSNIIVQDAYEVGNWGSEEGEKLFYSKLKSIPGQLQKMGFKGEFVYMEHAIAHAASTFYPAGFEEAAILSIDGIGELESTTLAYGSGKSIDKLQQLFYPNSLGFLWEKIAKYLGYSEYDACKVMSIASFGNKDRFKEEYKKFVTFDDREFFKIDKDIIKFRIEDYSALEEVFQTKKREFDDELMEVHQDIAAGLQEITTQIIMKLINTLYEKTGSKNLCMAGGVVLNCVTNRIVFENSKFENIYIQPAANDAGTALGAALKLYEESGDTPKITLDHTYLGPSYSNHEIEEAIKSRELVYHKVENLEAEVAKYLSEGKVIGWFQGRMEFGPRALGNRSLLADPRDPDMVRKLNKIVKHREDHRPFCPSVLAEEADKWFEIKKYAVPAEYMLMAYPVVPEKKALIPAVVHVDGTSRIQKVRKDINPRYHKLISHFNELTGVPVLLNTSFNDREPIVCTPSDAIKTFFKTKIDYLIIGDYLLSKEDNKTAEPVENQLEMSEA